VVEVEEDVEDLLVHRVKMLLEDKSSSVTLVQQVLLNSSHDRRLDSYLSSSLLSHSLS
jgi:hypothetical protein